MKAGEILWAVGSLLSPAGDEPTAEEIVEAVARGMARN